MIKIVKKSEVAGIRATAYRLIAVVGALICSALLMLALGHNPIEVFSNIVNGSIMTKYRLIETLRRAIPLVILSLGISVAFKMKFWNIGAEGQLCMGAFGASFFALYFPDMPQIVLLPLMFIAAMICGGIWASIASVLKLKFGTNETLVTLMLNYVALKWISFLQYNLWRDPEAKGFALIPKFSENAKLPNVFGLHIGWIIALVFAIIIYILMKHTKLGYEIEVIGENKNTANYAGMNLKKVMLTAVFISGALCGAAGMIQASGVEYTLNEQVSGGMGFTAVITAWLAKLSAPAIIVTSFLFAMLLRGGDFLRVQMQIPSAVSDILQGIILFFVLGSEFFIQYKFVFTRRKAS